VLELGAGMGVFSDKLAAAGLERLVLADAEDFFLARLRHAYAGRSDVEVVKAELPGPLEIGRPVESAVAMNVLEHIEDDVAALCDLATVVAPGGTVVLWVPAYMQLYGDFDRKLGHVRRYTPTTMRAAAEEAGLAVRLVRPVNLLGGVAWWAAVRRGGIDRPTPRLAALYDAVVVPASRALERLVRPPFGQSVLCVAEVRPS
jgi:SAM-dependent methyltransferase